MEKISFKTDRTDRYHVTDRWISNGHCALRKDLIAKYAKKFPSLNKLKSLACGVYTYGVDSYPINMTPKKEMDVDRVIAPSMPQDEMTLIKPTGEAIVSGDRLMRVVFSDETGELIVHIAPDYYPLVLEFDAYVLSKHSPVYLYLGVEQVGIVMPMRQGE